MNSRRSEARRHWPDTADAALATFFPSATSKQLATLKAALTGSRGHTGPTGAPGAAGASGAGAANIGCRVYKTAVQSIPDSTSTKVNFDAETYDTDTMHDNVTNNTRITINTAGVYILETNIRFAYNNTGKRGFSLLLNNTTEIAAVQQGAITVAAVEHESSFATLYTFAAADYVEVILVQTSGGALNIEATNPAFPHFAAQRLASP